MFGKEAILLEQRGQGQTSESGPHVPQELAARAGAAAIGSRHTPCAVLVARRHAELSKAGNQPAGWSGRRLSAVALTSYQNTLPPAISQCRRADPCNKSGDSRNKPSA